jgi:hypothetical protein
MAYEKHDLIVLYMTRVLYFFPEWGGRWSHGLNGSQNKEVRAELDE